MQKSFSIWEHPIATLEKALDLRKQIEALKSSLAGIIGSEIGHGKVPKRRGRPTKTKSVAYVAPYSSVDNGLGGLSSPIPIAISVPKKSRKRRKKRTMSPEARAKIAAAQKARWAKVKR